MDPQGKSKFTLFSGGAASPDTPEPPGGSLARAKPDAHSQSLRIMAPAKINLRLKITGRREDGYHLLDMVMVKLDLADEIELELTGDDFQLESGHPGLPADPSNTILRAAHLVQRESGRRFGFKAILRKKIPVAAGLGGGSSDAAAVLKGLNTLLGLGWNSAKLHELGIRIGADVPFFLVPGPQQVEGIGERLSPVTIPPLYLILVNPGFAVSTAEAYRWFDDGPHPAFGHPLLTKERDGERSLQSGLTQPIGDAIPRLLENDLERVVIPRYPVLAEIKEQLIRVGALGTLMSGSGPTVFGLFASQAFRDRGYDVLQAKKDPKWWVWKTSSI